MLKRASDLQGLTIRARDGELGRVAQFYFDDEMWAIRYLVVDTGGWLTGRQVLISPVAAEATDWEGRSIRVALTREQVRNSPGVETDLPVSRRREIEHFRYYGWPYYWTGAGLWGGGMHPGVLAAAPALETTSQAEAQGEAEEKQGDSHLRSSKEVTGYYIEAADGDLGHVEDFIFDDESWAVRYLVVDTGNWWPGKKVLVTPQWVGAVRWAESKVHVNLPRDEIKNAPEFDPDVPISREYEERLHTHYRRPRSF